MQIQHNMAAMTASREVGIHSSNFSKSTEKLASGYKINRASDGAAELKISEKMRSQVRGMQRALKNAEEGADFVRVADGAMSETHAMLQRMREITVQSLNDTNTPGDRAALAAEFDQLQCEIDRVDEQTDFNRMPVFDKYEPSYYKINGCQLWAPNQLHTIMEPDNDLKIRLPGGQDYVITVPDGTYTTQELMDEIDDAFEAMKPSNPGFTLELTKEGFCDLVYQKESGQTEIASIDGYLTYLLYDNYNNNSNVNLLGTTQIAPEFPLHIYQGKNDTLIFYAAPKENPYEIVVSPGEYTQEQMINYLNSELAKMDLPGVVAKKYGNGCIQISGGQYSITGLKGNMFTLEHDSSNIHSVFYDNVCEGAIVNNPDYIKGSTHYIKDTTAGIEIKQDTVLRFKFNAADDPNFDPADPSTYDTIDIPAKNYIIDPFSTADNNLYTLLKNLEGIADVTVTAVHNFEHGGYSLQIESNVKGTQSSLLFYSDPKDPDDVYKLLFEKTHYHYSDEAYHISGKPPTNASLSGRADLDQPVELPAGANTISVDIGGSTINLTVPPGTYNGSRVAQALNDQLSADEKSKIQFADNSGYLQIISLDESITELSVSGSAYEKLFTRIDIAPNTFTGTSNVGNEEYIQGNTKPNFTPAELVMNVDIPLENTVIDSSNNELEFYLYDAPYSRRISLQLPDSSGNGYTRQELVDVLNEQLKNYPVKAELRGNKLALVTVMTGNNAKPYITVDSDYGSAWGAFIGVQKTTLHPLSYPKSGAQPGYFYGRQNIHSGTPAITAPNNTFRLNIDGTTKTITVDPGKYTDGKSMAQAIQDAIDKEFPPDPVTQAKQVTVSSNGQIVMSSTKSFTVSDSDPANPDSFYATIFNKENDYDIEDDADRPNPDTLHIVQDVFIVGRQDIRTQSTTIAEDVNDEFIIDLTVPSGKDTAQHTLKVKLPPGIYTGLELAEKLTELLNKELDQYPEGKYLDLKAEVGGQITSASGSNDQNALSITLVENQQENSPSGTYRLDGVRGSASYSVFYKTSGKPIPSYIVGGKDLSNGVTFGPDNNTLSLDVDGKNYTLTFPDGYYPPDKLLDTMNNLLKQQKCPLSATLENGKLKLSCNVVGSHTITNITGNAKATLLLQIDSRDSVPPFMLQVGANAYQGMEVPRLCVGTVALRINSLTITRPKYANKALVRLDEAINLLSAKRSTYGALQNRLEHVVANNANAAENAQASESRIRDADMALEMIHYTKHRILTQASEAVLAQAKQIPNVVLSLLQQ
ncbi:MAG: hypothetical protein HFH34_03850 [Eubacterium sp.]|nr:hypothetical protein [Eubacterium sp.]